MLQQIPAVWVKTEEKQKKNERNRSVRAGSGADGLGFLPCFYMILGAYVSRQVPWGGDSGSGRGAEIYVCRAMDGTEYRF